MEATIDRDKVEKALDKIRPALRMDGGDVELVDIEGKVILLRMTGACGGCPMSQLTLQMGIEATLREEIPDIEAVEAVGLGEDNSDLFGY
jgi:Fe-S cluster biogenesis protein NfuA